MDIDTGQKSNRNEISMENDSKKEKEVVNSSENQQNNEDLKKSICKGILLEIDYWNEQLPDDSNEIEQIAIEHCIKLLE
jgi:predicted transglutaminase-like protease